MSNSTGPSITANVCPCPLTYHRRSPQSLTFISSASSFLSFGGSPDDREGDHAMALRLEFPAPLEVSGRIETEEGTRSNRN